MKPNTNLRFDIGAHVLEIHEVEFSSRCNLACRYCPHPKMARPKADMTEATFERVLVHLRHLCDAGTQGEVSLTGIGEAILHEHFVPWMHRVRQVIGADRKLVVATNGILVTPALVAEFKRANATVFVSTHRPEKAGPAVELLRNAGVTFGTNTAFVDSAMDWAGQVPWYVSAETKLCAYLQKRWVAVRQDGAVNTCCMDAESLHPTSHVDQPVGTLVTFPTKLCEGCHQAVPLDFRINNSWPEEVLAHKRQQEAQVTNEVKPAHQEAV